MKTKNLIVIFLLILLSLFLSTFFQKNNIQEQSKVDVKSDASQEDSWRVPSLPAGYNWETKQVPKEFSVDYRILWESMDKKDDAYGDLFFSHTVYFTDITVNDPKQLSYLNFVENYGEAMVQNGWDNPVLNNGKRFTGVAADGVFGSTYGMVKILDNKIRSIGYSYNMSPASWDGPGSEIKCPCKEHLEVIVGDEVDLTTYKF